MVWPSIQRPRNRIAATFLGVLLASALVAATLGVLANTVLRLFGPGFLCVFGFLVGMLFLSAVLILARPERRDGKP